MPRPGCARTSSAPSAPGGRWSAGSRLVLCGDELEVDVLQRGAHDAEAVEGDTAIEGPAGERVQELGGLGRRGDDHVAVDLGTDRQVADLRPVRQRELDPDGGQV